MCRLGLENCPDAMQGLLKRKEGKLCSRLEVVCDDNRKIWHPNFDIPGSRNDMAIIDNSLIFKSAKNKRLPYGTPDFQLGSCKV